SRRRRRRSLGRRGADIPRNDGKAQVARSGRLGGLGHVIEGDHLQAVAAAAVAAAHEDDAVVVAVRRQPVQGGEVLRIGVGQGADLIQLGRHAEGRTAQQAAAVGRFRRRRQDRHSRGGRTGRDGRGRLNRRLGRWSGRVLRQGQGRREGRDGGG